MTPPLLELCQLSCERDDRILFSRLSAQCNAGDLVQVLGPNGSGKTSLLRCLAGISRDYRGEIRWRGHPVANKRWDYARDLLFLGHLPGLKKALNPLENLRWYTAFDSSIEDVDILKALAAVGLAAYEDTPCYQLSAGQLRRVALARLQLSKASIWILDEPFTAIDKDGIDQLQMLLQAHLARAGLAILTSHQDLHLPGLKPIYLPDYQALEEESQALQEANGETGGVWL